MVKLLLDSSVKMSGSGRSQYLRAQDFAQAYGHLVVANVLRSHSGNSAMYLELVNETSWIFKQHEYLLNHLCALSAQASQLQCTCMRIYGVFVDATRTEVATQELNTIAQAVRNRQETGRCAQGCRVVFFDWNLIGLLQESNDDPSGTIWRSGFVGCLAFIGENNTRVKELWTWEEAIQGSHET